MRLLVTGSSGLIGTALVQQMQERHEVIGYDRKLPRQALDGFRFLQGDVLDREPLAQAMEGVDAVIHLAAIAFDVPPLHEVFRVNLQGTYNALDLATECGVSCFIHASSIMGYGFGQNVRPQYLPVDEEHPMLANRTYGLSKLLAERLCRSFTERCGIRTICLRMTAAMATPGCYDSLPFVDESGKLAVEQYFDVRDLVAMIELAIGETSIDHDVFLVSAADSGRAEPTPAVIERHYPDAELRYDELGSETPLVSMEKARKLLGFEPQYSWRPGERGAIAM